MKWAIRDLLNPVATRSLLYGTNPFDLEYVMKKIDGIKVMSGKQIQAVWLGEWARKIERYEQLAVEAEKSGRIQSARAYRKLIVQCHYACFMINTDDVEKKTEIYDGLADAYTKYAALADHKIEYVEIETKFGTMPAYLHFPDDGKQDKYACVVTYSGIGSCKEELEMLAEPLNERGIAVLCVDMPCAGAAVIHNGLKCRGDHLDAAFDAIPAYLESRADIDSDRIGHFGLCMGGGYAFRASTKHKNAKCCVNLFPLFLNFSDMDSIPIWMKRGKWAAFQYDYDEHFLENMKQIEEGEITCDYFLAYSEDDNWMTTEASMRLYDRAKGYREKLFVDEKPAYVSEESIMHAMPVGEQFHWVKHLAADFIAERLTDKESSK